MRRCDRRPVPRARFASIVCVFRPLFSLPLHFQVISSLGVVLFRALDYGLRDDEERSLSAPLEALIDRLTGAAADDEARDEGIECETSLRSSLTFDDVIQVVVCVPIT
jgi:hypothetical protein